MKKALLTLAAVAMAGSAYAQGTILFSNSGLTAANNSIYDALIKMPNGTANADSSFTVGLFSADGATMYASDTIFGTSGLFFGTGDGIIIPGSPNGSTPTLLVRAWQTSAGNFAASPIRGFASFTTRPLGGPKASGPADVPADMGNFGDPVTGIGFIMTPEPSTYALGMLGLGALALIRRRKA
jgi:MYXO-CTERM domain-containing protein